MVNISNQPAPASVSNFQERGNSISQITSHGPCTAVAIQSKLMTTNEETQLNEQSYNFSDLVQYGMTPFEEQCYGFSDFAQYGVTPFPEKECYGFSDFVQYGMTPVSEEQCYDFPNSSSFGLPPPPHSSYEDQNV